MIKTTWKVEQNSHSQKLRGKTWGEKNNTINKTPD